MINDIKIFLFIVCNTYLLFVIVSFLFNLFSEQPKQIEYKMLDKIMLLLSFSYALTFLIT